MKEAMAAQGVVGWKGRPELIAGRDFTTMRTVVVASVDRALKERLRQSLTGMRWQVREAGGGAEAMAHLDSARPEALLLDSWLPDLEVGEFAGQVRLLYPGVDMVRVDGGVESGGARSPRRNELLHALREAQEGLPGTQEIWPEVFAQVPERLGSPAMAMGRRITTEVEPMLMEEPADGAIGLAGRTELDGETGLDAATGLDAQTVSGVKRWIGGLVEAGGAGLGEQVGVRQARDVRPEVVDDAVLIAEMVGRSGPMRELARMIRLVAPRTATVLIEGETGTGKEVVAKALHRLSARAAKSFTVLNCAAIPETLLEAELFGHTRGAFTGAVQSRTGRIEAAHGGTLFLDEIGEMPLALQSKMLRFLECGELQRVGDNETVRVDVRVIAATHQPLEQRAAEQRFRLDLYHRLAVFPVEVPALRERMDDLPLLVSFFLEQMGKDAPRKRVSGAAMERLAEYSWPGNVRELMHVLERGAILAEDRPEIGVEEVRLRRATRG